MITSVTNEKCFEFRGTNADFQAKKNDPSFNKNVGNGSIFFVMDQSTVYMFNEDTKSWILLD